MECQEISFEFREGFRTVPIKDFQDLPCVIVDLRGNYGGRDDLAADMAGFFYDEEDFYESASYYDEASGSWETEGSISISPQKAYYDGTIVVLVNDDTISSGEGVAMGIQRLSNGYVVGFTGTNGSFGMAGAKVVLPEGWTLYYPYGRSLDESGAIHIDSDAEGVGGIQPDFVVPWTAENRIAWLEGDDVELEYAINVCGT